MAGRLGGKFMDDKIVSEFDRIRSENSFPMEHDPTPDLSRYSASKPPRFWLPRRALALAALVLVLTTLAAALWPENLKGILRRNRDVSQIGVPGASSSLAPSPVTTSVTKAAPSPSEIAANNDASEPEPPTEGVPADSAPGQGSVTQNKNAGADNPSSNAATESA